MHLELTDPVARATAPRASDRPAAASAHNGWAELLAQVSGDIAAPLTTALERVQELTETGRIDRQGLRRLREEVAQARQVAMIGQRLARYAAGDVRPCPEHVDLARMLRDLLHQRAAEWRSRGLLVRPMLEAAEVQADPSLLFGLVNTLLDWTVPLTCSPVDLRLRRRGWPEHVQLVCRFAHRAADEVDAQGLPSRRAALDTLSWRLLQQLCALMDVTIVRSDEASECKLTIEFAAPDMLDGVTAREFGAGGDPARQRPLAGSVVLVVSDTDLAQLVQNALSHMDLQLHFRRDLQDAHEFCRRGLPRALVCQASAAADGLAALREEIGAAAGEVAVIEIEADGDGFEVADATGSGVTRVGRGALLSGLPAALAFELARA